MPSDNPLRHELSGKQRAGRMPLDYYKKSDKLESAKNWLSLAAAIFALLAWLVFWLSPWPWGEKLESRGDVAAVHAIWDKDCNACHVNFQPISQDAAWTRNLPIFPRDPKASDALCAHCHSGPAHHKSQKAELTPACAHCHRDHQGRDFDLKRMADSACTGCHANLSAAMSSPSKEKKPFANTVTSFVGDHPSFRGIETTNRGGLKFNHEWHLSANFDSATSGKSNFKLEDIPEAYRERYQMFYKDGKFQLNCEACHQLDGGDFGLKDLALPGALSGVPQPRAAGAYYQPITYENQCRACHPRQQDGWLGVPHRLQPDQVRDYLVSRFTTEFLKSTGPQFKQPIPLPGSNAGPDAALRTEADAWINSNVAKAERTLYRTDKGCVQCHSLTPDQDVTDWSKSKIVPTNVPQIWLPHARFDHSAHCAMKCADCHDDASKKTLDETVTIPNRDNCLQCHNHAPLLSTIGRARADCVECHRYHNGDHGGIFQGIGAKNRGVKNELDVKAFLQGR